MSEHEHERFETEVYLQSLSSLPLDEQRERLKAKRTDLEGELASIKSQIDRVTYDQAQGLAPDPDWWHRLQGARRVKGFQIQQLILATGKATKALKAAAAAAQPARRHDFARYFMKAARESLDPTTYRDLLERARLTREVAPVYPLFKGTIYYEAEDQDRQQLSRFCVEAPDQQTAERLAFETCWDARLDAGGYAPIFVFDDMENPDDDALLKEPVNPPT